MAKDVDSYLAELNAELAGADPAVVQDALYDAEEFLRSELDSGGLKALPEGVEREAAFAAVVERYGTPAEVAAAYRTVGARVASPPVGVMAQPAVAQTESSVPPSAAPPTPVASAAPVVAPSADERTALVRFLSVVTDPATYKALLYMIIALATGVAYFTIAVTGISLSAGLIVLLVGPLVALGFLALVRVIALAEGRIVEVLLGVRMPRRPRIEPRGMTLMERIKFWLTDRRSWTALVYMILQLPLGIAYFTIAVTGLSVGLFGVAAPFLQLGFGHLWVQFGAGEYYTLSWWEGPLWVLGGVILLLLTLHAVRLLGRLHGGYAKAMLVKLGQRSPAAGAHAGVVSQVVA